MASGPRLGDVSVTALVQPMLRDLLDHAPAYGAEVHRLSNGATVVDLGVHAPGGWAAARRWIEISFGGLAQVGFTQMTVGELEFPAVEVAVDFPADCLLGVEISGWVLDDLKGPRGIPALGSGPARAVAKRDKLAAMSTYRDPAPPGSPAVLVLQTEVLPMAQTAADIAAACRTSPDKVVLLCARTGSLVGCANLASRALETTIELFPNVGLDPYAAIHGFSRAPMAPPVDDDLLAMARTNTFVYYGGTVIYTVDATDDQARTATNKLALTPENCPDYGADFLDLFEAAGKDIFQMTLWQSVGRVVMHNRRTGSVFAAGAVDEKVLLRSLRLGG